MYSISPAVVLDDEDDDWLDVGVRDGEDNTSITELAI